MPTKKKLPTGPIKIEVPSVENTTNLDAYLPDSMTESSKIEDRKQDSPQLDNSLVGSTKLDSNPVISGDEEQETTHPEYRKQDSANQETALTETDLTDSENLHSNTNNNPETGKQVTRKQDYITEYKKVAMRLSSDSASRLREFRGETGIPYEILVDVMVRNWDNLPKRTQNAYLKESQQIRAQRLIAGQQKAMLTTQKKYSQL